MDAVICGIDPGLGTTGYALLRFQDESALVVDAGICRFDDRMPLARRLWSIEQDVSSIFAEHRPDVIAVEQLYSHYGHPRTAILMGHARGVVLCAAARLGIEVRNYAATQVKRYLTGRGRASKAQVQRAVQTALGLEQLPEPPDVADAIALALCCGADVHRLRVEEVA